MQQDALVSKWIQKKHSLFVLMNTAPLNRKPLKWIGQFIYLGSEISSAESDVNICIVKACSAFDKLSNTWKFDLSDKIKR